MSTNQESNINLEIALKFAEENKFTYFSTDLLETLQKRAIMDAADTSPSDYKITNGTV